MKKRLLLASLPALLILSACNGGAQKKEDNNIFLEDSLAHDEIFDNRNFEDRELMPRRADPVVHPDSDVSIGIQCFEDGGNVNLRFVAAVSFAEGQLTPTDAVWTRSVYSPDGVKYSTKFDAGEYACTTAYKKISNGGSAYSISDFNTDHKTSYTHFVVYTLRNIPKATYSSYYVSAYLTLSPNSEGGIAETRTKAIAVRVDGLEKYTYDPFAGEYFMVGSWSASPIPATTIREDGNKASFEGLALNPGDTFVIKEFYNTKLEVHNSSVIYGNVSNYELNDDDANDKIGVNYKGTYNFFLKYDGVSNQLYTTASNVVTNGPLYVDVNVSWWGNDSAWTSVYAYSGNLGDNTGKWFALSGTFWGNTFRSSTSENFFTATTYAAGYNKLAVCRLKNGTNLPEDKTIWDTSIIHNYYTVSLITNGLEDCAYLYNNVEISMGSRS